MQNIDKIIPCYFFVGGINRCSSETDELIVYNYAHGTSFRFCGAASNVPPHGGMKQIMLINKETICLFNFCITQNQDIFYPYVIHIYYILLKWSVENGKLDALCEQIITGLCQTIRRIIVLLLFLVV